MACSARAQVVSTAGTWAPGQFGVVFQRDRLVLSNRPEHQPDALYPDLSEIGVQTTLADSRPALTNYGALPGMRLRYHVACSRAGGRD